MYLFGLKFKTFIGAAESRIFTHRQEILFIAGVIFSAFQVFILSAHLWTADSRILLLWLCNNFCIFLAIGCFSGDIQLLKGISYVGLLPQLLWIIDFIFRYVGVDISNTTNYIFLEGYTYANIISIFLHLIVPMGLVVLTYKVKPLQKSLYYSMFYIGFLYLATLLLSPKLVDVNCVYYGCSPNPIFQYTVLSWPFYMLLLTIASYYLHYGFYKLSKIEVSVT